MMKYNSENSSMAFLYDIARLLSASHLLAHLLADRTKKDLYQARQVPAISAAAARVAHFLIWPSSSAFLTQGNHLQIILVTRPTSAFR
jgi:hypothetical protein